MAVIQEYFAQQPITVSNRPRATTDLVATGTNVLTEAITGAVQQVSKVVTDAANIEAQKQDIRDNVTLAELKGQLDEFEFTSQPDPSKVKTIGDFNRQAVDYYGRLESMAKKLPYGKSQAVQEQFGVYFDNHRVTAKRNYQNKSRPMEKAYAEQSVKTEWINRLKTNVANPRAQKMHLEALVDNFSGYLDPATVLTLNKSMDRDIEGFNLQFLMNADPDSALQAVELTKFHTEAEKNTLRSQARSHIARIEREQKVRLQQVREETNRQMLADYWNGDLKDVQKVTNALDADLITAADAKSLRNAMLNPDPPTHKLTAEADVRQSIEDIGTNVGTKEDALSILYAHVQELDPTKGSSMLNDIFAAHDKNIAEIQRESRITMEELIRDKDPLSGLFTGDERQILANSEAYLMLDEDIQKAAREGKPLSRRDTLIRATEIGRQMKKKIKAEEERNQDPTFRPDEQREPTDEELIATLSTERQQVYRDGSQATKDKMIKNLRRAEVGKKAISIKTGRPVSKKTRKSPVPVFVMDGKEPEIVFDSEGKELGLKVERGGVWKIGDQGYISGKLYEYTGNGNWKAVK